MLSRTMRIDTAHFGNLRVNDDEVVCFPLGLPGLENRRRWVLLTPPCGSEVSWLQSVESPETALAVVHPRQFFPEYQLRTKRQQLDTLDLHYLNDAYVLVTVNQTEQGLTLNLKAPLVINGRRRLGRQVIASGDMPVQYLVDQPTQPLKKTA